jgi:hypothetical protein
MAAARGPPGISGGIEVSISDGPGLQRRPQGVDHLWSELGRLLDGTRIDPQPHVEL